MIMQHKIHVFHNIKIKNGKVTHNSYVITYQLNKKMPLITSVLYPSLAYNFVHNSIDLQFVMRSDLFSRFTWMYEQTLDCFPLACIIWITRSDHLHLSVYRPAKWTTWHRQIALSIHVPQFDRIVAEPRIAGTLNFPIVSGVADS